MKEKILIVDDDLVIARILVVLLQRQGYQTETIHDGELCRAKCAEFKPELILLDVNMPFINGIEVCRKIKTDLQFKDIPVIFVTADTSDEILQKAYEAGGSDYIRKPVSQTELLARVRSILDQRQLLKKTVEEERLRGVLEMAGAVCHELNQPMQSVSGYAELLTMQTPVTDPRYDNLAQIYQEVMRMGDITKKLMRITRYQTKGYLGDGKIIDIDKASSSKE